MKAMYVAFIFLLSIIIMIKQLTTPAYFTIVNNDAFSYSSWAFQLSEALREGVIYPRWMPLDFGGYGSPSFVYYPPLSFYIVALVNIFTDSVTIAMNVTRFISLFLSGVGIFFLVEEIYSEKTAAVTAVFYMLLPYNIMQFYLLGSFASTISFMWFSPILLTSYKYIKTVQIKYLAYAGICYGGLILTHVINAYMFTFVVLAFLIYLSITYKRPRHLFAGILIIVSGVAVSAAYVFPLVYEKNLINVNGFLQGGAFYFANCFLLPNMTDKASLNPFWPFNYNTFAMFALVIFYCCIALFFIISIHKSTHLEKWREADSLHNIFLCITLVSIFLLFAPSRFLWEIIPFFKYIHFPFRWLNITAFAITLLFASFVYRLKDVSTIKRDLYFSIVALFTIFIVLDFYYISNAISFSEQELIPVRAENSSIDHLPVTADIKKLDNDGAAKGKITFLKGRGRSAVVIWKSAERVVDVDASQPITARIRTFNFPGWTAHVDDRQAEIKTETGTGAMLIDIPEGKHRLHLIFKDTPVRFYGELVSLLTLVSSAAALLYGSFRKVTHNG